MTRLAYVGPIIAELKAAGVPVRGMVARGLGYTVLVQRPPVNLSYDGLPLAVELAAARIRTMSLDEVRRALADRFALLRGHDRSAPARHQTLTAVIAWSWDLLSRNEQHALERLSVFHDGFSAAAVLAVLGADVRVGAGSVIERAVVLDGARIGEDCVLRDCIVAPGVTIGDRSQVVDGAMLGEGVTVGADNVIARGARLFPGMEVPDGGLAF